MYSIDRTNRGLNVELSQLPSCFVYNQNTLPLHPRIVHRCNGLLKYWAI